MGPSNAGISFWFVVMLLTGVGMLKDTADKPKMLVVLIAFVFISSAWLFMWGLLTAMRPGSPQVEVVSGTKPPEVSKP